MGKKILNKGKKHGIEMTVTEINSEKAYSNFMHEYPLLKKEIPKAIILKKEIEVCELFLNLKPDNTPKSGPYKANTTSEDIGIQEQKIYFILANGKSSSISFRGHNVIDQLCFSHPNNGVRDIKKILLVTTVMWYRVNSLIGNKISKNKQGDYRTYSVVICPIKESEKSLLRSMISR